MAITIIEHLSFLKITPYFIAICYHSDYISILDFVVNGFQDF